MKIFKLALLVIMVVLVLFLVIDRSNEPERTRQLKQSIDALSASVQQQAQESRALRQTLEARPAIAAAPSASDAGADQRSHVTPAGSGNGVVKLDENFLLPYDTSYFHPEWIGGVLNQFAEAPKGLNPITESSSTANDVNGLVNDSLCSRDPVHPELWRSNLATSLVISDDYKVYTFHIRKGVMWQRPPIAKQPLFSWLDKDVELTAKDFAFYLEMVQNPDVQTPHMKVYYDDLDHVETPDNYTLRVIWKRKVYSSLSATMELNPLPRHIYGAREDGTAYSSKDVGITFNDHWFDNAKQAAGVGAYIMETYQPDKELVFRRNAAYWGTSYHFEGIHWDGAAKQPDPQLVAFKNGQVHTMTLSPTQYKSDILGHHEPRFSAVDSAKPKAGRGGELGWERCKGNAYSYLGWNMRTAIFSDKHVRQAMSHAFPRQRLIDEVYYGLGQPQNTDVQVDSPYYNRDVAGYAFDLDASRKLLADAGWSDTDGDGWLDKNVDGVRKTLKFSLKYYANRPEWDSFLQIYRNELRKIGIDMNLVPLEWKALLKVYEDRDFEAIGGGWQMSFDVDFFQLWHSSQADLPSSSNHCGFRNQRVDELSDKLRLTFVTAERIAIAKEIQAILYEEQPYTFFRSSENIFAWQNKGSPAKFQQLDGVIEGLDTFFPLFNRNMSFWHFRTRE